MIKTTVKGVSNNGNFNEALQDAIDKSLGSINSTFAKWRIKSISGSKGGFVGANTIEVVLEVSLS